MIDYKPTIVEALQRVLPTYYELILDSDTEVPCISYVQINDIALQEGDTIRFSNPVFQIKVWGRNIEELAEYCEQVDFQMRCLRFKRQSYNELTYNGLICCILQYKALSVELD